MASLSNSGIKEMSSSHAGKSFAGTGGKDGYTTFPQGATIELKDPVITFEDMKQETKEFCFKIAEEAISKINIKPRTKFKVLQTYGRIYKT